MASEMIQRLARLVAHRDGTLLYPKGDGRVEIPHGIVRFMGWSDKSTVWIGRSPGCLVLSNERQDDTVGRVAVSMERVRVPMSILKSAAMGDGPVVVSIDLSGIIVVRRHLEGSADLADLEGAFGEAGEPVCQRLLGILGSYRQAIDAEEQPIATVVTPKPIGVPQSLTEWKYDIINNGKPKLFLMNMNKPTIIRVVGMPFAFQAHWVPAQDHTAGRIVPHSDGCSLCSIRAPERMSLVPVIKKSDGRSEHGFLLAQEDLRSKIASRLAGRNPTDFDLVLYFAPFQDGMCSVYIVPPEVLPDDLVKLAQAACADPDGFVAETFGSDPPEGRPARAPMFIVEGHFAEDAKPRNLAK